MPGSTPAGGFEIRIRGRVGEPLTAAFPDLTISVNPVETVLSGSGFDQARLYGLLERIRSLGLELLEVRRLPPQSQAD